MKYTVKFTKKHMQDLLDAGWLAINDSYCISLKKEYMPMYFGEPLPKKVYRKPWSFIEASSWPGAGGTYFVEHPELEDVEAGDSVEFNLPNGQKKVFVMPFE